MNGFVIFVICISAIAITGISRIYDVEHFYK